MASTKHYGDKPLNFSEKQIRDFFDRHLSKYFHVISQYSFRLAPRQRIGSLRPDFIVVNDRIGSVVLEVKDYKLETILGFRGLQVKLNICDFYGDDGYRKHPHVQADEYIDALAKEFKNAGSELVKRVGKQDFALGSAVIFTNILRSEFVARGFDAHVDMERTIFSEDINYTNGRNITRFLRKWLGRSEFVAALRQSEPEISSQPEIIVPPKTVDPIETRPLPEVPPVAQVQPSSARSVWFHARWAVPALIAVSVAAVALTSRSREAANPIPATDIEVVNNTECLHVRENPSPTAPSKGLLPSGTNAKVLDTASNGWKLVEATVTAPTVNCHAKVGILKGYVNPAYLTPASP